jgi:hypothetical protein
LNLFRNTQWHPPSSDVPSEAESGVDEPTNAVPKVFCSSSAYAAIGQMYKLFKNSPMIVMPELPHKDKGTSSPETVPFLVKVSPTRLYVEDPSTTPTTKEVPTTVPTNSVSSKVVTSIHAPEMIGDESSNQNIEASNSLKGISDVHSPNIHDVRMMTSSNGDEVLAGTKSLPLRTSSGDSGFRIHDQEKQMPCFKSSSVPPGSGPAPIVCWLPASSVTVPSFPGHDNVAEGHPGPRLNTLGPASTMVHAEKTKTATDLGRCSRARSLSDHTRSKFEGNKNVTEKGLTGAKSLQQCHEAKIVSNLQFEAVETKQIPSGVTSLSNPFPSSLKIVGVKTIYPSDVMMRGRTTGILNRKCAKGAKSLLQGHDAKIVSNLQSVAVKMKPVPSGVTSLSNKLPFLKIVGGKSLNPSNVVHGTNTSNMKPAKGAKSLQQGHEAKIVSNFQSVAVETKQVPSGVTSQSNPSPSSLKIVDVRSINPSDVMPGRTTATSIMKHAKGAKSLQKGPEAKIVSNFQSVAVETKQVPSGVISQSNPSPSSLKIVDVRSINPSDVMQGRTTATSIMKHAKGSKSLHRGHEAKIVSNFQSMAVETKQVPSGVGCLSNPLLSSLKIVDVRSINPSDAMHDKATSIMNLLKPAHVHTQHSQRMVYNPVVLSTVTTPDNFAKAARVEETGSSGVPEPAPFPVALFENAFSSTDKYMQDFLNVKDGTVSSQTAGMNPFVRDRPVTIEKTTAEKMNKELSRPDHVACDGKSNMPSFDSNKMPTRTPISSDQDTMTMKVEKSDSDCDPCDDQQIMQNKVAAWIGKQLKVGALYQDHFAANENSNIQDVHDVSWSDIL